MYQKLATLMMAALFAFSAFTYEVKADDHEEPEILPECSWNNPCYISISDGDFDNPETNNTDEGGKRKKCCHH